VLRFAAFKIKHARELTVNSSLPRPAKGSGDHYLIRRGLYRRTLGGLDD